MAIATKPVSFGKTKPAAPVKPAAKPMKAKE